MQDTVNAFIKQFELPGSATGPLAGLTFGAKDLYDIAGHVTGFGNPDWAKSHPPASRHAPAVQMLLDASARLVGKTHTDELAYSLMGANAHYGTPINTAAPERVPGGSSSGSVAATAAGLVDIGLGSDTGGSVRLPASFSGVYGIRTTHGRISLLGAMPLASSFDTVGWFARDAVTFARVAAAFAIPVPDVAPRVRLLLAEDAVALASPSVAIAVRAAADAVGSHAGAPSSVQLAHGQFAAWRESFRICQGAEAWKAHGAWITELQPKLGPGVRERFQMASAITPTQLAGATTHRQEIRAQLMDLLRNDGVLLLPTSPGPAPLRNESEANLDTFRVAALALLCSAGLAGLPQINIPIGTVDGGPVGLSLIAAPGQDGALLALAQTLEGRLHP